MIEMDYETRKAIQKATEPMIDEYNQIFGTSLKKCIDTYLAFEEEALLNPNFMKHCEILLDNSRQFFMGTTIKFLIGKTRDDKGKYLDVVSDLGITEDAINVKEYADKAFKISDRNIINQLKSLKKDDEDMTNLLIIRDRIQSLRRYWKSSSYRINFETYYFSTNKNSENYYRKSSRDKINSIKSWNSQGLNGITNEQVRDRYALWKGTLQNRGYRGIVRDGLIFPEREGKDAHVLYAYDRQNNRIAAIAANAGHLLEGVLHQAASISPIEEEYDFWINNRGEELKQRLQESYWKNGKNIVKNTSINIDQAMIAAKNNLELFRGGDVNFILYRNSGDAGIEAALYSYQVKGTEAKENGRTIITGLLLLHDFLYGTSLTLSEQNILKRNKINRTPKLKKLRTTILDVFYDDISDILLKIEPALRNQAFKNAPEYVKLYLTSKGVIP